MQQLNSSQWVSRIQEWGRALGFSQIGVAGVDLTAAEPGLSAWLAAGCHGDMFYMASHGLKRARPAELVPGTLRVITARNPVHAALHLILAFFTCGGIWALLQAEFLALLNSITNLDKRSVMGCW